MFVFRSLTADAVSSGESAFVPITPCRLFDTRPGSTNVGPLSTPLGANSTTTIQVTGNNGSCSIPAGATAVSINLTGASPSASTNLRIFPANATVPTASVLNMTAGQAPVPNKVDVQLSPAGAVAIYNEFGTIHVIGDVMGYYLHAGLADLESRLAAVEAVRPLFAEVDKSGTLTHGSRVVSVTSIAAGEYRVKFDRSVRDCAASATIGDDGSEAAGVIDIAAFAADDTIVVFTQTNDGVPPALQPRSFHLLVMC